MGNAFRLRSRRAKRTGLRLLPPHVEPHRAAASWEAAEVQGRVDDPRGGGGGGGGGVSSTTVTMLKLVSKAEILPTVELNGTNVYDVISIQSSLSSLAVFNSFNVAFEDDISYGISTVTGF